MSESRVVEIFENEFWSNGQWVPDPNTPWTTRDNKPSRPADELRLPGTEWTWESNWRISKKPGSTDKDGWEFASRIERFSDPNRKPKAEKLWNDKCRRRQYSRVMRRDGRVGKAAQFMEAMPRIQKGLRSIYTVRVRIEQVVKQAPDAINDPQMIRLVDTVRANMLETLSTLNTLDSSGLTQAQVAVIKKLRHDLQKEEAAIETAVQGQAMSASRLPSAPGLASRGSSFVSISAESNGSSIGKPSAGPPGLTKHYSFVTAHSSSSNTASGISRSPTMTGHPRGGGSSDRKPGAAAAGHSKQLSGSVPISSSSFLLGADTSTTALVDSKGAGVIARPSPKPVISGGRNVPLNLSVTAGGVPSNGEDGMFVQRSSEEQEILQKLKPVDHVEVNARIIEERAVAIEEIHKGLVEVNEMFNDLARIIREQQGDVDAIFNNCEESHAKTAEAFSQIVEADRLQQESCIIS